ncbi:GAF and ANTAR domain-containing protein [Brachybacterium sp. J153]|uniref:GAF and ANTAR domain-containing protein n=1 Tax=Brachybacterium sp. J153 TaxID=3116488 RepID=UPI002E792EDF|nr:GAF and ANTAR domain-containing protein [Brachybacterium sp. J153]MEE1617032.1 GAF and ANTAR domain-containing protein [Brachybacterium sp. J153]
MLDDSENDVSVSTMQSLLLQNPDIQDFLQDFTDLLARQLSLGGPDRWCAVSLLRERKAATAASSGPQALALDELQNSFTDGPCMTAIRENTVIRAGDLRSDGRWPDYAAAAQEQGVRAVLGLPFDLEDDAKAGLNVYSATPHDFDPVTVESIALQVEQASSAMRLAVRQALHSETARDLRAAMESRTVIDLAVGILMGRNRCSQEEAIGILKSASNHRNVALRDLAATLVASVGSAPARTSFDA